MLTPNVNLANKTILVTGAAGFIGANLVTELLNTVESVTIVGLDNMNDYYDVSIKEYRLAELNKLAETKPSSKWIFVKGNLADRPLVDNLFSTHHFDVVVNLAAQAGVRYSCKGNADRFLDQNPVEFFQCRKIFKCFSTNHCIGRRFQPQFRRFGSTIFLSGKIKIPFEISSTNYRLD